MEVKKIDDYHWQIPVGAISGMKVPGLVIASQTLLEKMKQDKTLIQCAGVATLPGIYKHAITLPDGHEGFSIKIIYWTLNGFPIGGVAALDYKEGGISPGGIGLN